MFGTANSIELVPSQPPVAAARSASRPLTRPAADEPPIREVTPAEMASAARRQRTAAEPNPVEAAPAARGGFFRRRPVEAPKPDAVAQRHGLYVAEKRGTRTYYADYRQKQEVMRADGDRISTKLDDKQTVAAVLDLAQAQGWNRVRVRGTEDFKRETWVQAQVRGMAAEGYKPSATDEQEAERRKAALGPVQSAASRTAEGAAATGDNTVVQHHPTSAMPREMAEAAPVQAVSIGQPERTLVAQAAAAAPGPASVAAAPAAVQASTAAANDAVGAADGGKAVPIKRSRAKAASKQVNAAATVPAAVQASTAAASDGADAAGGSKAVQIARSKAVWGAVEEIGKQARAADAVTAKATAGERPTAAATA